MNEEEINKRLKEISELQEPLYKEDFKLREELRKLNTEKLKKFLYGKAFKAGLSQDYKKLYLTNNKLSGELHKHGVTEYHESFYDGLIGISCDDGDITIYCNNDMKELLNYSRKMEFLLDFSEIRKQENNISNLLDFLKSLE
jgi:hypothetical protein